MTDLTKAETITVADGKYIISNNNGALTVLRNGEPWNRDLSGDNLVYWMFVEIQQLRAALAAQQAAQPVAQGFNPAADCSPALTQCPRCNNPNGVPCDGGRASQPVAWTDDQMNRFAWTCSAPALDAGSIMDRLRAFREYEATRGRAIPAEQPQQDELQQAKDRIDRLETEMRKLRGNLRGVFDRELWDSLG